MRLTLRTMLAYMDDILEPADAEVLEKKINESEFATNLMQRIRAATQKIRLSAPKLDGKGIGLDPNTVAAYLDNGLPQDRIPEFEKICLESEAHLAEVAACHQILALVLGERVDVPPELRQKMCQIVDRSAGAAAPGSASTREAESVPAKAAAPGAVTEAPPPARATDEPVASRKRDLEVPDYLRTKSHRQFRSLALTVAVAFLVVLVSLRALGPFDHTHPLLGWLSPDPSVAEADSREGVTPENSIRSDPDEEPSSATDDSESSPPEEPDGASGATPSSDAEQDTAAIRPKDPTGSDEPSRKDEDPAAPSAEDSRTPMTAERDSGISDSDPEREAHPPNPLSASGSSAAPETDAPETDAPETDAPETDAPETDAPETDAPDRDSSADAGSDVASGPMEVGRFMTGDQVVGRYDPQEETWFRLAPRAPIRSHERLLVLPLYRPQFALTSDIQMMVAGPADLRFETPVERQIPAVQLRYGRAMVDTIGPTGARIALQLAGRQGTATLTDSESTLAAEVGHFLPPGSDPQTATADRIVRIQALSGQVLWKEGEQEPIKIAGGQELVVFNDEPGRLEEMPEMPAWVQSASLRDIDLRASRELERLLNEQRSLGLSLEEVVNEHRQVETRALATRALSYLDTFAPFVTAFNDEWQYSYWWDHFDALRQAIFRGPETAAEIRMAFEKHRPEDAELLYRLVWGYSPEQLAEGADAELVALLEHPKMDVRALAFENLRRITGKTHHYRPEKSLDQQRRRWLLDWQQDLAANAITYDAPASRKTPLRPPAARAGAGTDRAGDAKPPPAPDAPPSEQEAVRDVPATQPE